jgi:hypothetical protein
MGRNGDNSRLDLKKIICIIPVYNSQKTNCVSVTKTDLLIPCRKLIAVYSKNHTKPYMHSVGKMQSLLNVRASSTSGCQCALKF